MSRSASAAAILPVKRFASAKQRLHDALDPSARVELVPAMVLDVVSALVRAATVDEVLVVSADPAAEALLGPPGVQLVSDEEEAGQSAAAVAGIARARASGHERVLLVPGDCPLADPAEIDRLLEAAAAERLDAAIVPDRHDEGTNALVLEASGPLAPAFGEGSLARHVEAARRMGIRHRLARVASLALDVDTPDDLAALEDALRRDESAAPRTRAALARLGRPQRVVNA
jgi:2-phospho-L-lactate/phosphoenolpyruvate guanylyltransferase